MRNKTFSNLYFKILLVCTFAILIFRIFETISILSRFGYQNSLLQSEFRGLLYGILFINSVLILLYPLAYYIFKSSEKFFKILFHVLFILFIILHFFILKYFFYQLIPLDIFLYNNALDEILFTIRTSDVSFILTLVTLVFLIVFIYLIYAFLRLRNFNGKVIFSGYLLAILLIPLFVFFKSKLAGNQNKFEQNKSLSFYSNSITYSIADKINIYKTFTKEDASNFQKLFCRKNYTSIEYPLVHNFDTKDSLGCYFQDFDRPPNIVILIFEGLNDEFIHKYRGISLMPYLSSLKDSSLYWNRCFTLGERSYAVVPSLLGSLPYGNKGFTVSDILPRHLSLLTILKSNNYFTSFFIGQGGWFHKNDRFFKYNNADLVFDNSRFSSKYKKIIVGRDNFFWGYNDKDLFSQSLEVVDTIKDKSRLDVYFTGTCHSPYIISDEKYYGAKFNKIVSLLKNSSDIKYFNVYRKYILSILFVDDALKDFFSEYQKRPDYSNTIFIITGDHPMSEIPAENALKKYHVPLIIFSEKLNTSKCFMNVISHLDFYNSALAFLNKYGITIPSNNSCLGRDLFVNEEQKCEGIPFMNDNRQIIDYYSHGYYLSGLNLFKVDDDLNLNNCEDKKIRRKLQDEIISFKRTNQYVFNNDRIIPDRIYCNELKYSIFLSESSRNTIEATNEYTNIINDIEVQNQDFFYDVSFNYKGGVDDDFTLVLQLATKKDSIVFWHNNAFDRDKDFYQEHYKIPRQKIADSVLIFKSFFWNKKSNPVQITNSKLLIYKE
jgi:phosphoglycerol transferase MdoB-like AlkP superfamily enzyme